MEIIVGNTPEIISKAQLIRHQVFVLEQRIPQELDLDGLDTTSSHALVTDGGSLVATARLSVDDGGHAVMARVAVVKEYRGSGIASKVIDTLMSHARQSGVVSIEIHAHEHLRSYYQTFGFEFIREVEVVGEHQLIEMRHQIAGT